jgi:hypothetical protein
VEKRKVHFAERRERDTHPWSHLIGQGLRQDHAAHIELGMAWDEAAFELRPPGGAARLKELAPGERLVKVLDLGRLVGGDLEAGTYEVQAYWRNDETGRRFGVPEPPASVGLLETEYRAVVIPPR